MVRVVRVARGGLWGAEMTVVGEDGGGRGGIKRWGGKRQKVVGS